MGRGKRSAGARKLNWTKVFLVIILPLLIIALGVVIRQTLKNAESSIANKQLNYFSVCVNEKWGVIDSNGKIIIEPTYEEMIQIPIKETPLFICTYDVDYNNKTYKTKTINEKNEEILTSYSEVTALDNYTSNTFWYEQSVLRYKKDDKYGLIDYDGRQILDPVYDNIIALKGVKNSFLVTKDGLNGLCNNRGEIIVDIEFHSIVPAGEDYKEGYIVTRDGMFGYYSFNGRKTVSNYQSVEKMPGYNVIKVKKDEMYGLILDVTTNTMLDGMYEDIKSFCADNVYVVKENGRWIVIDKDKKVLLDSYEDYLGININNIIVMQGGKYGIADLKTIDKAETIYDDMKFAFEDYCIVKQNDKYGVVNTKNEVKIEAQYNNINYRKDIGIIEADSDLYNKVLIKVTTGVIAEVNIDKAYVRVRENDTYNYYNLNLDKKEAKDVLTDNTLILDKKDGKYGFINKKGEVKVDYIYDEATEQNPYGFAAVKKGNLWGAINRDGKEVVELKYNLDDNQLIDFIGKWHVKTLFNNCNYYTDK